MNKENDSKRQRPRRLFSFDSVKSVSSSRRSSAASDNEGPKLTRPLNPFDLSNVQEGEDENEVFTQSPQEIMAPAMSENSSAGSPVADPFADRGSSSSSRLEPVRPMSLTATRSTASDSQTSLPTPTRARWEQLRHHVLPSSRPSSRAASRPSTPPPRPGSALSSAPTSTPARSGTPKPSRLARLGFRQVVEQARDLRDETRKLGEEILRGCALARYPEVQRFTKDGQGSQANLTGGGATSSSKMDYLRRPQSVISLSASSTGTQGPSLRALYQILIHRSGSDEQSLSQLPHESQVLSTLLCPFLTPSKYPETRLEEERITAMESYELLPKSWVPSDESATVERCLWCCKAAGTLPPCLSRTRILGSLWRILVPGDNNRILLSTHGFQSISSGLVILLATLYRTSASPPPGLENVNLVSPSFRPSGSTFTEVSLQQPPHPDINLLQDLVQQFLSGSLGEIEDDGVEEVYGVEFGNADRRHMAFVRRAVFLDSLMNTVENSPGNGEWLLCHLLEQYWSLPDAALPDVWTTLQAAISSRKLNTYCRLSLQMIQPFISRSHAKLAHMSRSISSSSSSTLDTFDYQALQTKVPWQIVTILQTRVIPEVESLDNETELDVKVVLEARVNVARLLLEILCLDCDLGQGTGSPKFDVFGGPNMNTLESRNGGMRDLVKWAADTLAQWYRAGNGSPWKSVLEATFAQVISAERTVSIAILSSLVKYVPADLRKAIFSTIIPLLNEHLVQTPPPYPFPELVSFLTSISKSLPPVFFRPLFACAMSDQDIIIINHLSALHIHSKYVSDYWVRDVDMLCMALLADAPNQTPDSPGKRTPARLGQLIIFVELIGKMQFIRHEKEGSNSMTDGQFAEIVRFVTTLEHRLWLMVEAKERKTQLAPSICMLLCVLFREFRLLTKSLKPPLWIAKTLKWFEDFLGADYIGDMEQEVETSVKRIQDLYAIAEAGTQKRHDRPTSILAAAGSKTIPSGQSEFGKPLDLGATFTEHLKLIDSLSKGYVSKSMKLFVTMSTLIDEDEFNILGPLLWEHCLLDNVDPSSTASACFLLMQCAEKTPVDLKADIEIDLKSSNDTTRLEAVRKMSILINWRFQIITQNFLTDRSHRPFKLARPPLPFIATDMGTIFYVYAEDSDESKENDGVPLELRQRLAELGFAEDDDNVIDPRQEWIKTPMSILPANQFDRMEVATSDLTVGISTSPLSSPQPSPQPSPRKLGIQRDNAQSLRPVDDAALLLRRNSSSGGPMNGAKRRAIFVPSLTAIFPQLATLIFDSNVTVASTARTTIMDLMRNDPALLTRPIFEYLAGESKDIKLAITTLTTLIHIRRLLPPPFTHNIFNNLAGLLKLLARNSEIMDSLRDFSLIVPVIATIGTQVSGMSVKEIRRSKLEHFFIPTGSLWFSTSAPKGSMFPRHLKPSNNPFEQVPPSLVSITMIRVSQNMFFLSMLKRNYQDVQVVRKNMSRLILPSLDDHGLAKNLEMYDYLPHKAGPDSRPSTKNVTIEVLSLMVCRSYILLVAQIFRSMPRHLSDRHELAVLVDGLNRALVTHGDDINIVSQVLIGFMVASTRFRRLFTTGGGYTLFMPALVKVYTENPSHPGIRLAIEYAINRFYALHEKSFLYQSINTIGQVAMLPNIDVEWFSRGVYDMFLSLRKGASTSSVDAAGIRNVNKAEEREALIIHTADEKPQTFLASIRRVESQTGKHTSLQLPDEYESIHLSMDNFVRLFLTVIVHDLSIARAQYFLRLLRYLTPHLYHSSGPTRNVLKDGIEALGAILTKVFSKPKGGDSFPKPVPEEEDVAFLSSDTPSDKNAKEKSRAPSDSKIIRLDYLQLVLAFGTAGGEVSLELARFSLDIVKSLLKDWGETKTDVLATFLGDFVKLLYRREEPSPKAVVSFLRELSPILHSSLALGVNLTAVFEGVLKVTEAPVYANDLSFAQVVVGEIITAGLAACDLAASENYLMALPYRTALISLLAEAVFLKRVDVIGELEKRPPTYDFLAGVILPLALVMKTESELIIDPLRTDEHLKMLAIAWLRILFYAINACQKSRKDEIGTLGGIRGLGASFTRPKSSDKRQGQDGFWRSHLPTFLTALQVIKVVIVRGSADISSLPQFGIWERISGFCKTMFAEGNADFALRQEISSAVTTPTGSPRASAQFDLSNSGSRLFVSTSSDLSRPGSPLSFTERKSYSRPRIIDYSLWSMLEFVCAYRSPLRMHLKVLMMEKVVSLDEELQKQGGSNGAPHSPYPASPSSRRVSTSLFSKSRHRLSSLMVPSPDSSPRLAPQSSSLMPSPSLLDIPSRRPGYQISPVSPHDHPGLPKIVHLGPTSPSAFPPMTSPMIGAGLPGAGVRASRIGDDGGIASSTSARSTKIKSLKLIKETYRRVRGVQTFMGYDLLLPVPGGRTARDGVKENDDEAALETWSRQRALANIMRETRDLIEEFEEGFGVEDEAVLVDNPPESRTSYSST